MAMLFGRKLRGFVGFQFFEYASVYSLLSENKIEYKDIAMEKIVKLEHDLGYWYNYLPLDSVVEPIYPGAYFQVSSGPFSKSELMQAHPCQ
jgi:hypothetical protein